MFGFPRNEINKKKKVRERETSATLIKEREIDTKYKLCDVSSPLETTSNIEDERKQIEP